MEKLNLEQFLNEGTVIRTRYNNNIIWFTNVIYGICDDCIEIDLGLRKDLDVNTIMVGDTIKCKYTTEEFEYILLGWINKINLEERQSITVKVHNFEKFNNLRDSYRYDIYLSASVLKEKFDTKGTFIILSNISKSGVAFILHEEIDKIYNIEETSLKNTGLFFEVLIKPDVKFTFEGRVVWKCRKEKGVEHGVKFIDMSIENHKILNSYIGELENNEKVISEQYKSGKSGFWSKNSKLNSNI